MGKKNKKKSQQKRQVKNLKRRAQQKASRKVRNVEKAHRKIPGMPGIPGGIPPHMQGMAEQLIAFSMPIFEKANPQTPGQMNKLAVLIQGWWSAFQERDLEKRDTMLQALRGAYESQPWAEMPFDELSELLLKRHISLMPQIHSEAEKGRFTAEELENAMAFTPAAEADEEVEADIDSDFVEITEPVDMTEDTDEEIEPVSVEIPVSEEFVKDALLALLEEHERETLLNSGEILRKESDSIDYIDSGNPLLQKLNDFQESLGKLYLTYLKSQSAGKDVISGVQTALTPFYREFLGEYHQTNILAAGEDEVEEYLMDYYLRKVKRTADSDRYVLDGFKKFFLFLEELGFTRNAAALIETIEDIRSDFEEDAQDSTP